MIDATKLQCLTTANWLKGYASTLDADLHSALIHKLNQASQLLQQVWDEYESSQTPGGRMTDRDRQGNEMTQDDIIDLGHKAGTLFVTQVGVASATTEWLEQFAALVAAAEREACAKVVEASPSYDWHRFACEAAAAIRARSEK